MNNESGPRTEAANFNPNKKNRSSSIFSSKGLREAAATIRLLATLGGTVPPPESSTPRPVQEMLEKNTVQDARKLADTEPDSEGKGEEPYRMEKLEINLEKIGRWIFIETKFTTGGVYVFVPKGLPKGDANVLVYMHGFNDDGYKIKKYGIPEAVMSSGLPAIVIMPVGLKNVRRSDWGKLLEQDGLKNLLADVLSKLKNDPTGELINSTELGRVVLVAHSGGGSGAETILSSSRANKHLSKSGVDKHLNDVIIFDTLHSYDLKKIKDGKSGYQTWLANSPEHKLSGAHTPGGYATRFSELAKGIPKGQKDQVELLPAPDGKDHNTAVAPMLARFLAEKQKEWRAEDTSDTKPTLVASAP